MRADLYAARELGISRNKAAELLKSGELLINNKCAKCSDEVADGAKCELLGAIYVSRAAFKLKGFLNESLTAAIRGARCVDVGASTGGFTQILLECGAASVAAVDVGRDQLHESLRRDARVSVHENTDVREFYPAATDRSAKSPATDNAGGLSGQSAGWVLGCAKNLETSAQSRSAKSPAAGNAGGSSGQSAGGVLGCAENLETTLQNRSAKSPAAGNANGSSECAVVGSVRTGSDGFANNIEASASQNRRDETAVQNRQIPTTSQNRDDLSVVSRFCEAANRSAKSPAADNADGSSECAVVGSVRAGSDQFASNIEVGAAQNRQNPTASQNRQIPTAVQNRQIPTAAQNRDDLSAVSRFCEAAKRSAKSPVAGSAGGSSRQSASRVLGCAKNLETSAKNRSANSPAVGSAGGSSGQSAGGVSECAKNAGGVLGCAKNLETALQNRSAKSPTSAAPAPASAAAAFDFLTADVSFIPLASVLADLDRLLRAGGQAVLLFKPQFEVGRAAARSKAGVVKDERATLAARAAFERECAQIGWILQRSERSQLAGKEGNFEYLYHFAKRN